ncbi:MAG: hypothetical protein LBU25_01445 [Treponema sp.]|nr:hypothetical protein [Treponema sp.]
MQKPRHELFEYGMVCTVCLLGAGISVFLFWQNLTLTMTKQNEAPVGSILFKERIAQRRFGDRTAWDTLKHNSPIYNHDIIHTGDLSEAGVLFSAGDRFELRENSIVQITVNAQGTCLNLNGGNINIQTSESGQAPLTLIAAGHALVLDSGSLISAGIEGDESLYVRVLEGTANITTRNGTRQNAEAGTAVTISDAGVLRSLQIAVLQPKPSVRIVNPHGGLVPVSFVWKAVDLLQDERIRLDIAQDRTFTQIHTSFDSTDSSALSVDLPSGTWYWRIYPLSRSGDTPEFTINDTILILDPPELTPISPAAQQIFTYRVREPLITFSWDSPSQENLAYQVLVADNPRMEGPVYTGTVAETSLLHGGLAAGTWYWQVKPVFTGILTGAPEFATEPLPFSIVKSDAVNAPELLVPLEGSVFELDRSGTGWFFSWKALAEADTYTVQIGTSPDLQDPLILGSVTGNYFIYQPQENLLGEGEYFWGMVYTDKEGIDSPVSPVRSFRVRLPSETPDDAVHVAAALTELERAKTWALQHEWTEALEAYKRAGTAMGFSQAQTQVWLSGIMALQDQYEQEAGMAEELQDQLAEKDGAIARLLEDQQRMQESVQNQIAALEKRISRLETENRGVTQANQARSPEDRQAPSKADTSPVQQAYTEYQKSPPRFSYRKTFLPGTAADAPRKDAAE